MNETQKKQMVDAIMTNAGSPEGDRPKFLALPDEQLTLVHNTLATAKKASTEVAPVQPKAEPVKNQTPEAAKVSTPEPAKIVTLAEYIAAAPKAIQDVLNNSVSIYEEEKARLVAGILANKNNAFTEDELKGRPLGELRNLSRLGGLHTVPRPQANYGGQAPVPTENADAEEPMEVPSLNFAAAAK